jgi:diacylglycerol kinase family enzyme
MRITLIHNPDAGEDDHAGHALRSLVARAGHDLTYRSLEQRGWEEALADPGDLVVVAGGDGSVGKVFREIATKRVPVTLLPVGSANNIARAVGIADRAVEALVAGWDDGELRRFDLGVASAPWGEELFAESIGGGIFGEVLARAPQAERAAGDVDGEEKVDLGLELLREVIEGLPVRPWQVDVDGDALSGEFLAVELMNTGELGPNFPLAPDADPGDGLLEVVLLGESERPQLLAYFAERLRDVDPPPPDLPGRRGRTIAFSAPADVRLHVDDELWPEDQRTRRSGDIVVEIGPSLDLLVPVVG